MVESKPFGRTKNGEECSLFYLYNNQGHSVCITDFGARIVEINVPDSLGKIENVVLAYDRLEAYENDPAYLGAIVGRYASRIHEGKFEMDGKTIQLSKNEKGNHLHGGAKGFDKKVWKSKTESTKGFERLTLSYFSPDGEEGYPGNLEVSLTYTWNNESELSLDFSAKSNQKTIINLTSHSYFNLSGFAKEEVLNHLLMINSKSFAPMKAELVPQGTLEEVSETPFDFSCFKAIGKDIENQDPQLKLAGGYDHSFFLQAGNSLIKAASLYEPKSKRLLEISTTEVAAHLYSGNYLPNVTGRRGMPIGLKKGVALEMQHFGDSPNQPAFPSTILEANTEFKSSTLYKFTTVESIVNQINSNL